MLNVMVLAGGDSERFVGYSTPKQYLKFNLPQRPVAQMWWNAKSSLTVEHMTMLVARYDHRRFLETSTPLNESVKSFDVRMIQQTKGQVQTAFLGLEKIMHYLRDDSREILILNCDSGYAPGALDRLVSEGRRRPQVAALTFMAPGNTLDRWSYVDHHPSFKFAEERKPWRSVVGESLVQRPSLAGAYYFPKVDKLFESLDVILADDPTASLAEVFEDLQGPHLSVEMKYEDFYDWGTPEALNRFMGYK